MSVSQATTSVRASCAAVRGGRTTGAASAAPPAVTFKNDRRSMRLVMPASFRSLLDGLGGEEDGLRAVAVVLVQLADELLACRGGDVLLVLRQVADLDALDVAPLRTRGGIVDGPLDPEGLVADDAGQCPGHPVVVLSQPPLVGGGIHPGLEGVDDVAHDHGVSPPIRRPPARSSPGCPGP